MDKTRLELVFSKTDLRTLDALLHLKQTQHALTRENTMEHLIHHFLKRLEEKELTKEQRDYYKAMVDEYSNLYLQELYS